MKKNSVIKVSVIVVILALLCVGYFAAVSKKGEEETEKVHLKDWKTLIEKDLEKEYPPTPTALAEYYSELLLAYYNESCEEDLFEKLLSRSRELYDKELLQKNDEETQLMLLKEDVSQYKEEQKSIINYTVCGQDEVEYGTLDEKEVARLSVTYRIRKGSTLSDLAEEFFMRKDSEGKWKIVGWQPE